MGKELEKLLLVSLDKEKAIWGYHININNITDAKGVSINPYRGILKFV